MFLKVLPGLEYYASVLQHSASFDGASLTAIGLTLPSRLHNGTSKLLRRSATGHPRIAPLAFDRVHTATQPKPGRPELAEDPGAAPRAKTGEVLETASTRQTE